jgi:hypothetical protein
VPKINLIDMHKTNLMPSLISKTLIFISITVSLLTIVACKDNNVDLRPAYDVTFNNEYSLLNAKIGVFISDDSGNVKVFSWLKGKEVQKVSVPYSDADVYDVTVVKVTYSETLPGFPEDQVVLTTYKNVRHNAIVNLRDLEFEEEAEVKIQFLNLASLDSLVMPEGTALVKPEASNNFFGNFKVNHTGDFWFFGKFNGQNNWKYFTFKNFAPTTNTFNIKADMLASMSQAAPKINLPFETRWRYHLDGILDVDQNKIIALGDIMEEPDARVGRSSQLEIFKPEDIFINGFKVELEGTKEGADGYTYRINRFYSTVLPNSIEAPTFNVEPALLNDKRTVGVACTGDFDGLVVTRTIGGTPSMTWEMHLPPVLNGIVSHRIPDIPEELRSLYPKLGNYAFDAGTLVRAERYKLLFGFEDLSILRFENADAFWQTKNELLSVEKTF